MIIKIPGPGVFARLRERVSKRATPPADHDIWYEEFLTALASAGIRVTPELASKCSAVFGCVRTLSKDISSLPLHMYKRTEDDGRILALEHPLYEIMHLRPNPDHTSMEYREAREWQLGFYGEAFSYIERDTGGKILSLRLFPPRTVRVFRAKGTGDIYYTFQYEGKTEYYLPGNILHDRDLTSDGITAISPIRSGAESIGLSVALEQYGSNFFKNGVSTSGHLTMPNTLTNEGMARLKKQFKETHGGLFNAHKPMILEGGMEFKALGISPEDAQALESRKFQLEEIAGRIYGVPLHKLGHHEHSTFSNIEHLDIEYAKDTIRPKCTRREQRAALSLLTAEERKVYYFEHSLEGLFPGDHKSQALWFSTMLLNGVYSINDVRKKLNEPPVEGGDTHQTQVNLQDITKILGADDGNK